MSISGKDSIHGTNPKDSINVTEANTNGDISKETDAAWNFLDGHHDAVPGETVDIAKLRRRIDFRIVPLMFLCYTLQFLDKVILNYAAVMGINKDLHLKGNDFSNIATFLFVGLLCLRYQTSTYFKSFPLPNGLVSTSCSGALLSPVVPLLPATEHCLSPASSSACSRLR